MIVLKRGDELLKSQSHIKDLKLMANTVRRDLIEMLAEAGSGHTAGSLGMVDVFTALYFKFLNINSKKPSWKERDILVLSNGHICPVQYACLARRGFFPVKELKSLRKLGSRLQGHPHRTSLPGLETTSGPLGSGLSQACGIALADRMDGRKRDIYCITSDGEHEEGNTWEGVMFAAKYNLDITCVMDRNRIQIGGDTESVMPLKSLKAKYKAFNWKVIEIDGNDMSAVVDALQRVQKIKGSKIIIAHTMPGKDVASIEGNHHWHGKVPNADEKEKFLEELEKVRFKIIAGRR